MRDVSDDEIARKFASKKGLNRPFDHRDLLPAFYILLSVINFVRRWKNCVSFQECIRRAEMPNRNFFPHFYSNMHFNPDLFRNYLICSFAESFSDRRTVYRFEVQTKSPIPV